MYRKYSVEKGFTLVELLFTVAIIGVLTAIAMPVYMTAIDKSNNKTAINDIITIQTAIDRYYTETFTYPTTLAAIASELPNSGNDPWGNPYVYFNIIDGPPGDGKVRHDGKAHPINTFYDLYSKGKDGESMKQLDNKLSVDDIVLGRDGAFIGLASDF
jgi:general secretion pathway protein G